MKAPESEFMLKLRNNKTFIIKIVSAVVIISLLAVAAYFVVAKVKKTNNSITETASSDEITEEDASLKREKELIEKKYNENPDAYLYVDLRFYQFSQKNNGKDFSNAAKKMFDSVTDEKSFIEYASKLNSKNREYDADSTTKLFSAKKESIEKETNAELAKWAFANDTAAGQKKLIAVKDKNKNTVKCIVAFMVKPKHDVESVNVRSIFFRTTAENGELISTDKAAQAQQNAEKALAQWEAGDKSEKSFAEAAAKLSEDKGSKKSGGLCSDVLPGKMTKSIDNWAFDSARKPGDVQIIKSESGYHLMYFVSKNSSAKEAEIKKYLTEKGYI